MLIAQMTPMVEILCKDKTSSLHPSPSPPLPPPVMMYNLSWKFLEKILIFELIMKKVVKAGCTPLLIFIGTR